LIRGGGSDAQRRVAELEAELARTRAAVPQPAVAPQSTVSSSGGVAEAQKALADINAELDEMDSLVSDNPYEAPEGFFEKQRNLFKLQAQATARLADLLVQTTSGLERQRTQEQEAARARAEDEQRRQARETTFAEMDDVGSDAEYAQDYRLSKPAVEVEAEYLNWRADIAAAFYGRPAGSANEENAALDQLQARNPVLLQNCQLAGISAEPSQDVRRFIDLCNLLDYRDGWRPDPANPGKLFRLQRFDAGTGGNIPVTLPSLKAALAQKRVDEGYYKRQVDQAYQRGAHALAVAQTKRDPAVAELNDPSTMGQSGDAAAKWAVDYLVNVDEEEAMRRLRAGDPSMFDGINKARAICGIEPITFDQ
jgi:hypothetical protein